MLVVFKATTINSAAATLNVNGLGAIAITKFKDQALEDGDIEAGQLVVVVYNSTGPRFEMINPPAIYTGSGTIVRATTPTLITPVLGVATATSVNGITTLAGWIQTAGTFTATPASTSTLTMTTDLTASILVGMSLQYVIGGVTYYGRVAAIAANLLTINGAPLGGDVTALYYGGGTIRQVIVIIPGQYEDATNTDLIGSDLNSKILWQLPKSYLVYFSVFSKTHDSTNHGQASVQINNTEVNTTAGGETIAANATWYPTVVNIATAAYDINLGEELEVTCIKAGAGNASDLTVNMVFVTP